MSITIQFLLGLLIVMQICCLQNSEFILENGEQFTIHHSSVKFENFFFNRTHVESLVRYKIRGAIGSTVKKLELLLHTVNFINLDDKSKPILTQCEIFLRFPKDEFSRKVFQALENLIRNTTCINTNNFADKVFDTILGNNDIRLDTIKSILKKVEQITQDSISKYEHQRGVIAVVNMALDLFMKKFNLNYIKINDIITHNVEFKNLTVGNFTTLTKIQPLEIYRKNNILTVDATFEMRPHLLMTARGHIWNYSMPEMKITAFAKNIEVRIKLNFDYSVEPCRIEVKDTRVAEEKLTIRMLNQGFMAKLFNSVFFYLEKFLTLNRLLPRIKSKLQKMLDSKNLRSICESLRPIFLLV